MGGLLLLSYLGTNPNSFTQIKSAITVGSSLNYYNSGTGYAKLLPFQKLIDKFPRLKSIHIPHGITSRLLASFSGRGWDIIAESFQCVTENSNFLKNTLNKKTLFFHSSKCKAEPHIIRKLLKFGFHSIPIQLMISLSSGITNPEGLIDKNGFPFLQTLIQTIEKKKNQCPPIYMICGSKDQQCPLSAVEKTSNSLKTLVLDVNFLFLYLFFENLFEK